MSVPVLDESETSASVSEDGDTITVRNMPGAALPSTGGPGTAALSALGAALCLMALGGLALLRWRRGGSLER